MEGQKRSAHVHGRCGGARGWSEGDGDGWRALHFPAVSGCTRGPVQKAETCCCFLLFQKFYVCLNVSCLLIRERQAGTFAPENARLYSWVSCPSMRRSASHEYFLGELLALPREFGQTAFVCANVYAGTRFNVH